MTCTRWHRLGERCECGLVTVPARFYQVKQDHSELSQGKAEEGYLGYLKENMSGLHEKQNNQVPHQLQANNQVGKQLGGKRRGAGRPKKS